MGQVGVVFDTNVFISALGFGGTPLAALLRALGDDVELLASESTLAELDRVMTYDRLPFTDDDREAYLTILSREVELVVPESDVNVIERDPADNASWRALSREMPDTSSPVTATCLNLGRIVASIS